MYAVTFTNTFAHGRPNRSGSVRTISQKLVIVTSAPSAQFIRPDMNIKCNNKCGTQRTRNGKKNNNDETAENQHKRGECVRRETHLKFSQSENGSRLCMSASGATKRVHQRFVLCAMCFRSNFCCFFLPDCCCRAENYSMCALNAPHSLYVYKYVDL